MFRDILKKTGTYSIYTFAQRLTGLVLVPIYTRYLSPEDYGVMSLLDLTMQLFTLLVSVKLDYSLFYHWARVTTDEDRDTFLSTAFIGAVLLGVFGAAVGSAITPVLGPWLLGVPRSKTYLWLTFGSLACNFPIDIGFSLMRIRNQARHYTTASLLRLGLTTGLSFTSVVFLHMGLMGILLSVFTSGLTLAIYMAFFVLRGTRFHLSIPVGRKLLNYSLPLLLSSACGFVINSVDRFFLRWYVPMAEVGLYNLAYRLGMLVTMAYSPVELYWAAQMHQILNRPEGAKQFPRLLTYVVFYLCVVALGITVFVEPVAKLVIGGDFQGALKYVPWIALAGLLNPVAFMARSAIFVEAKTKLEVKLMAIAAIFCLAGYAILIPIYGSWGGVAGTMIGFLTLFVLGQRFAQRLRHYHFEYGRMARVVICMVVVAQLCRWISADAGAWQIALGKLHFAFEKSILWAMAAMVAFPLLLILTGFLKPDERERVVAAWRRFRGEPLGA